jgi:flagellar basal body rod protein FlgB
MAQRRAEVAASNIAQRGDGTRMPHRVDFSAQLATLARVAEGHSVSSTSWASTSADSAPVRIDRQSSGTQLDYEVAEMATAQLSYQALAEAVNRHFALARLAISSRG